METNLFRCSRYYEGFAAGPDVKAALLGKNSRYAPDRTFDTLHIRLDLDLKQLHKRLVNGRCTTWLRSYQEALKTLEFDAAEMRILRVESQGKNLKFRHQDKKLKIFLSRPLALREEISLTIHYRLSSPRCGLHFIKKGPDARGPQVWSQGQPEESHYWFPCHDAPHEKATTEMVVQVPAGFVAVSNGHLVSREPLAGGTTFHWKMSQPHSIYLVSVAVGQFSEIKDQWENIPVAYYCEKGREEEARRSFGKTPQMLALFSSKIGVRYPYAKYAQVIVSQFPGGMENTTCTTQTDAALLDTRAALDTDFDTLVAHELAHQWFGDLLTCRDWSHAWLNEGFATYFEYVFLEKDKGLDEALYSLRQNARRYFDEDERRYQRPIVTSQFKYPWVLFDRHLYEKGGAVLHMLCYLLGETPWWKSIQHYVSSHRDGSVETSDLILSIEETTGRNLKPFFDQWVFKAGYPHYRIHYNWDAQKREASLWVMQTQPLSSESPIFQMPVEIRMEGRGWKREFKEELNKKEHHLVYRLPSEPEIVEFDPQYWILKKVDFKKPLRLWINQLQRGKTVLGRIEAAFALSHEGSRASVEALRSAFSREKFWGVQAEIATALSSIRTPDAFAALQQCLKVSNPKVRRMVVRALGEFPRQEVLPLVLSHLKDPSYFVSLEAVNVLCRFKNKESFP
ncbi:MAG: M1 family metallopeptidase, partial [Elusimicrobia bacterium]|nr:M1 family metallopeptidase [Elusimicrobiota bacterium]